ncbi:hypothetical protein ACFPYJ_10310 [Paenibacillus solisilvae]|uniref:Uncharacterized protein n=1 Tax=Paenibacillus solisilvae TaxID=2486751 RepID=A0ABW0VXV1_9BACL
MDDSRLAKALIQWDLNPSGFLVKEWLRDIVVNFGQIENKQFYGDTWTVLVRITEFIDDSWLTYADVAFVVDEAPWHLLEKDYSFKLWAGRDIAIVTII